MDFKSIYHHSKDLVVLYVEDDDLLRQSTVDAIEDYFASLDTAKNGKEALEKYQNYYKNNGLFYDLLITDIKMPVMNGIALIQEIHKIHLKQYVIVISAYDESDRQSELVDIGISNFLMKPLSSDKLRDTLYKSSKDINIHKLVLQHQKKIQETIILQKPSIVSQRDENKQRKPMKKFKNYLLGLSKCF